MGATIICNTPAAKAGTSLHIKLQNYNLNTENVGTQQEMDPRQLTLGLLRFSSTVVPSLFGPKAMIKVVSMDIRSIFYGKNETINANRSLELLGRPTECRHTFRKLIAWLLDDNARPYRSHTLLDSANEYSTWVSTHFFL